jgi:protoheme IX farnesyltransferase
VTGLASPGLHAADFLALTKPRITLMAVVVAALALAAAPGHAALGPALVALLGIGLVVGAANALNMVLERDVDALMERTRGRPLPEGRLSRRAALAFGVTLAGVALALLAVGTPLAAALAAVALLNYVGLYTPLKRRTCWAVVVGAGSGAMPVLMGWTAATGRLDAAGVALFSVLFLWQVPHFLAISIFRQAEYDRAGIRIAPTVLGADVTRAWIVASTTGLVPLSLLLVPLAGAGWTYLAVTLAANAWFLALAVRGVRAEVAPGWARAFFHVSLIYVPVIVVGLVVDGMLQ